MPSNKPLYAYGSMIYHRRLHSSKTKNKKKSLLIEPSAVESGFTHTWLDYTF